MLPAIVLHDNPALLAITFILFIRLRFDAPQCTDTGTPAFTLPARRTTSQFANRMQP